MAKVTSKLQVTIPKAIAERLGIRAGDDIDWVATDESLRVVPRRRRRATQTVAGRLRLFDRATERQKERERQHPRAAKGADRGWTREELYERGRPR